ncbi:MAG: undecaprenyl-diphosphate phosphatase [Thermoleophilia bacterium]
MSVLEAVVLGLLQGLTEFLPVSSTAHLRIVPELVGWEDPGAAFTAITQLGTLAAVLWYFRHDLGRIGRTWASSLVRPELRGELDARMGWYVVVATVPIGLFGWLFDDQVEEGARDLRLVAWSLILFGLVLLAADRMGRKDRTIERITTRDGIVVGLAQALALVPGVSRAGATLTAGLFLGLDRTAAARFSFLLSIPAVTLAGVYQLRVLGDEAASLDLPATVIATVVAGISGYATIAYLLRFLESHSMMVFVVYRLLLGGAILLLLEAGRL